MSAALWFVAGMVTSAVIIALTIGLTISHAARKLNTGRAGTAPAVDRHRAISGDRHSRAIAAIAGYSRRGTHRDGSRRYRRLVDNRRGSARDHGAGGRAVATPSNSDHRVSPGDRDDNAGTASSGRPAPKEVTMTAESIHAEDAGTSVTVTPEDQSPPLVAESTRTISGRVLPWSEMGRTNNGALQFAPGSVNIPTDVKRVKLLAGHSPTGIPIGHATGWESKADGLYMRFQVGTGADADRALTAAAESVIDAFSIEAYGIERDGTTVTASIMSAVALVPMPAFASARVETVNAAAPAPGDTEDTPGDTAEDTEDDDGQPAGDTEDTPGDTAEDTDQKEDTMSKSNLIPGTLPGAASSAAPVHASLTDVTTYLCAAVRGESAELSAELTDITDAGTLDRTAPAWLGELWSGVTYERRVIPLLSSAPLTSRKVVGYRWTTKPGVASYAGNKADIPSFPAAVEAVERDAVRWAGGNDLDRAFWDFGETEFLNAYWRAMAESYAFETDQAAGQFVVDNATAVDGVAGNIIEAVARGSIAIDQDLHAPAGFVLINPADYESILQLTNLDAPKYLDLIPATDPGKWVTSQFVPAGTVVLGTQTAATHYELSGSPLRVEAEHIAKGGRDAALFGYTALMLNRPEGLRSVQFDTAAAPTPPEV